jgi:hypothetical protein
VSRRWRAAASERSLWAALGFCGVAPRHERRAAARRGGARGAAGLTALDASAAHHVSLEAMLAGCAAAYALTVVVLPDACELDMDAVSALLAAAPRRRLLRVPQLRAEAAPALTPALTPTLPPALLPALRNEAPFGALRALSLRVAPDRRRHGRLR